MKTKRRFAEGGISRRVPAQVRTFAETVMGKRTPITEKDFTPEELEQARQAIIQSRRRMEKSYEWPNKVRQWEGKAPLDVAYDKTVGYDDYQTPSTSFSDFSVAPSSAMRNTLGRFRYDKTPEGRLIAVDTYDFKDDLADKVKGIPRTKDYEGMSTARKIGKLAVDTFRRETGGIRTLPSRVGNAFVGADGRPVRIDLGEAPFKKGGRVHTKQKVTRGDGIAKRGRTKGRIV